MGKVNTTTRVQITIEVDGYCYGEDWSLRDLTDQTGKETVNGIKNQLQSRNIRIIGEPKVIAISIFSEK